MQDVGYKGEIGYQTFLYSSEPEIRSLLMFLVEKLPRESAEASAQPSGTDVTPVFFPALTLQEQEVCHGSGHGIVWGSAEVSIKTLSFRDTCPSTEETWFSA